MTDQKYSLTTADPSGYWLIPNGVNDPKQWACMDSADPVKEIDDLRAKLEEAEKDKARLDWLESTDDVAVHHAGYLVLLWRRGFENFDGESVRAAIDGAREK